MIVLLLAALVSLQADRPPVSTPDAGQTSSQQTGPQQAASPLLNEVDLLRKSSFAKAEQVAVRVRVYDKNGSAVQSLPADHFQLRVNGTLRTPMIEASAQAKQPVPPLVLVVFPPNQREVHASGVKQARQYFARMDEQLRWKVALLDSDGSATDYTQNRTELLRRLDDLAPKTEPFLAAQDQSWLDKANGTLSEMRLYDGPRIVLAFNPEIQQQIEEGHRGLARYGPETLIDMALGVGAHIYVATVAGPGLLMPAGDASIASDQQQTQARDMRALVYQSSLVHMTAAQTMGGFANSVSDLGNQIDRDIEAGYVLQFPLTQQDRDRGVPQVEVRLRESQYRVALVDLSPLGNAAKQREIARADMAAMWLASTKPVASPDFKIAQRVDYFPARGGLRAVLPMTAQVSWSGKPPASATIHVAEYVENMVLHTQVIEKEIDAGWTGRAIAWERDGELTPGQYDWRIVVHDENGHVIASADKRVLVGLPESDQLQISTLLVGAGCRPEDNRTGLQHRQPSSDDSQGQQGYKADPLQTNGCRLRPSATGIFARGSSARLLVRIYPVGKLEKDPPERWSAAFSIRGSGGSITLTQAAAFAVDSSGGYAAETEIPLRESGTQILSVELNGPGLKKGAEKARQIVVVEAR